MVKARAIPLLPVRVFVEGGAKGNKALNLNAQDAFRGLIRNATGALVHVVAKGGRDAAFDAFKTAKGCRPLLLVDAEAPVADVEQPWAHLKTRDNWDRPADATDAQAHLMAQVMETWFLSDPEAFSSVVTIDGSRLPRWPALEQVAKTRVHDLIVRLTGLPLDGGRGSFKSKAFAVLARVDHVKLSEKCPAAARFFRAVRQLTGSPAS